MSYETLNLEIDGRVATITLDRPKAMNALNSTLISELSDAVTSLDANEKVRVIILTGNEKAFAAGADIKEMSEKTFAEVFGEDFFGKQIAAISQCRKPIIAAVSGYALGGGCEIAMMCDMIFCSDTAKFGQPEVNLGVMPGIGGSQRLTRFVGKSKSMDMCLTGRFMDAEEAERTGLAARVFPVKKLLENTKEVAEKIAEKSSISVLGIKEAVNRSYETTLAEGLLFERRLFHAMFATEDQKEGMSAFVEKRSPKFRNK